MTDRLRRSAPLASDRPAGDAAADGDRGEHGAHLTTSDLLAVRDGTATASVEGHIRACPECRREVERLHQVRAQLRALPSQAPPRDLWPRLEERIRRERRTTARRRITRLALVAVAAVLFVLAVVGTHRARERALARSELELALVDLRERSQLLDGELRGLRGRSLSAWRAEAIVHLEDELDEIDALLAARRDRPPSGEQVGLWLSRLELQSTMVEVHVAPVTRIDL
jgi:anti-sigma factor RsiW